MAVTKIGCENRPRSGGRQGQSYIDEVDSDLDMGMFRSADLMDEEDEEDEEPVDGETDTY